MRLDATQRAGAGSLTDQVLDVPEVREVDLRILAADEERGPHYRGATDTRRRPTMQWEDDPDISCVICKSTVEFKCEGEKKFVIGERCKSGCYTIHFDPDGEHRFKRGKHEVPFAWTFTQAYEKVQRAANELEEGDDCEEEEE